jgi:hypothetical protein
MAQLNKNSYNSEKTHEGGQASPMNDLQALKRSVMSCMLWENEFYEDGESIAGRIKKLAKNVKAEDVFKIADEAKNKMHLRHAPMWLTIARAREAKAEDYNKIINRVDDIPELLSMYWADGKKPIPKQLKIALGEAFRKFDEYQLAKYNRKKDVKLKDVMKLTHPKPEGKEQQDLWGRLINDELKTPDTWETNLSGGADKKETFTRLLNENKLGGMALLRNLRNMIESGVNEGLIKDGLMKMNKRKILPYRFISAAKHAPRIENAIEEAMLSNMAQQNKLKGKTILIIDVSGSMYGSSISGYSEMDRAKTACSLGLIIRELAENPIIYATAGSDMTRIHKTELVPNRRGFALSDAIYKMCRPLGGGGIFLQQVCAFVKNKEKTADRLIVITDEQDCDLDKSPLNADAFGKYNYLINVASNKNGISYAGKWKHIDGFSEAVIDWIQEYER